MIKMNKPLNGQIKHELMSWLRLTEFLRQENALLKYRLSELVDNSEDDNFLQSGKFLYRSVETSRPGGDNARSQRSCTLWK